MVTDSELMIRRYGGKRGELPPTPLCLHHVCVCVSYFAALAAHSMGTLGLLLQCAIVGIAAVIGALLETDTHHNYVNTSPAHTKTKSLRILDFLNVEVLITLLHGGTLLMYFISAGLPEVRQGGEQL